MIKHEVFELCVFNLGQDGYVVALTFDSVLEAVDCLRRCDEAGLEACIRIYTWNDEIREKGE